MTEQAQPEQSQPEQSRESVLEGIMMSRATGAFGEVMDGFGYLVGFARAGNADAREQVAHFVRMIDAARDLIEPPKPRILKPSHR